MVVQVLGEVPPELRVTPEQDERLAEQAAPRRRRRGRPPARADRRRPARDEGRRRRPHPARARAGQGRDARARAVGARRCRPASSGSRAAARAPPRRAEDARARRRPAARPRRPPRRAAVAALAARGRTDGRDHRAGRGPAAGRGRRRRSRAPPPIRAQAQAPPTRRPRRSPEELATEADPAPAVDRGRDRRSRRAGARAEPGAVAGRDSATVARGGRLAARASTPMLAAALEDAAPAALADDGLTLAWPESSAFLKRKAEDPANRELIAKAIRAVTGSLAAARLRAARGRARATVAPPALSEDDLVQAIHGRVRRGGASSGARGADLMPQPPNLQKMLAEAQAMLAAQQEAQEALKERAASRPAPAAAWSRS